MVITKTKIASLIVVLVAIFSLLGFAPSEQTPLVRWDYVSDPQSVLSFDVANRLNAILTETQNKHGFSIRLMIVSDAPEQSFDHQCEILFERTKAFEPRFFAQPKWAIWIVNAQTVESKILIDWRSNASPYLVEGLNNLEKYAIQPALAQQDFQSALFQGVFGLSTLLKPNAPVKSKNLIEKVIELYHQSLWFHAMVLVTILVAAFLAVRWYLRSPPHSTWDEHADLYSSSNNRL